MRSAFFALLMLLAAGPAAAQDVTSTERRDAAGNVTLAHEVTLPAPIAEVWTAVSTAEGWRTWAVPVAWDSPVEPDTIETSYTPGATPGDPSTIRQLIVARIPGRLLVFRTVKAPDGFPHFDVYRGITGFIELEPVDARRTRIRLTGVAYPDTEAGRTLLGFFREGNRSTLAQLHRRFAEGPIDWTARR